MSDAHNTPPMSADAQEATVHGRHRGQVSAQDGDSAPRGRHRKPADQNEQAAWAS